MGSTPTRLSASYGQRINALSDFNAIPYTRSFKNKGEGIAKFIKYFQLRWCGHVERMQNQRMPKHTAAATAEGIRNRRRPRERWRDEVQRDLNIMGIKDRKWPETFGNEGRLYWEPGSTTDCSTGRGGGGEGGGRRWGGGGAQTRVS
jgi:hypothetical protein